MAIFCLILAAAYAMARYQVFGGVPWSRLPLYTLNKAVALSAAVLFARGAGRPALWLATLHALMSLALLAPSYYPEIYLDGALDLTGELAMLAGCLAFALCLVPALTAGKPLRNAMLAAAAAHVCVIGFKGWLTPRAWPGYMPPITLLSFLILAAALAAKLARTHE